jgi:hypothetical protein
MIRITSVQAGFRRCGVAHPAGATDYPDDRFTKKELEILQAEPMLMVQVIDGEIGQGGSQGGGGKTYPMNAKDTADKIKAAGTVEEVDELAKDDERAGVIAAAEKRRKELASA